MKASLAAQRCSYSLASRRLGAGQLFVRSARHRFGRIPGKRLVAGGSRTHSTRTVRRSLKSPMGRSSPRACGEWRAISTAQPRSVSIYAVPLPGSLWSAHTWFSRGKTTCIESRTCGAAARSGRLADWSSPFLSHLLFRFLAGPPRHILLGPCNGFARLP